MDSGSDWSPTSTRPKKRLRYTIDMVALADRATETTQDIYALLQAEISKPNFSLLETCRRCTFWDGGMRGRIDFKPIAPGALDPTESCNGCAYSYLDADEETEELTTAPQDVESNISAIEKRIKLLNKALDTDEQMLARAEEALERQQNLLYRVQIADRDYLVAERPLTMVLRISE